MESMERRAITFLFVLAAFALACGLIDDEDTDISIEESFGFGFDIDADSLCPQDTDCSADPEPAPAEQELPAIEISHNIDIVDETNNEELRDYAGMFRSIEITRIDYETTDNTLSFDLPPTTIYIGPHGSSETGDEGVVELTTIPEIGAGQNKSGTAEVAQSNRSAFSELFQNLRFSPILYAEPVVKEGQDLPPTGTATMDLTVYVKFTANPQDL
jgi:hypothetical protein